MKAIYGKGNNGWYYTVFINGIETGGKRNLTYEQLQTEMQEQSVYRWIKDIDTTI